MFFLIFCIINVYPMNDAFQLHKKNEEIFTANLIRAMVNRMNKDYSNSYPDINRSELPVRPHIISLKEEDDEPSYTDVIDEDTIIPNLRDNEYLQHSPMWGHQFMTGGAGEGNQNLKPEGSIPNKNEVKTDAILPAYCNPPNPCPIGFTENDGCIENFENTAGFSRKYQAAQKCMCDSEHMFDCPSTHEFTYDNDMDFDTMENEKSRNSKKQFLDPIMNPYLQGEMLPIAAKKGINVAY